MSLPIILALAAIALLVGVAAALRAGRASALAGVPRRRADKLRSLDERLVQAGMSASIIVDEEPVLVRVSVRAPDGPVITALAGVDGVRDAVARLSRAAPPIVERGLLRVRLTSQRLDAWTPAEIAAFAGDIEAVVGALQRPSPTGALAPVDRAHRAA